MAHHMHIVGGAIGLLQVHFLTKANIPTTLLLRPASYALFNKIGKTITVEDDGNISHHKVDAASIEDFKVPRDSIEDGRTTVLVATKANDTKSAIQSIRHMLVRKDLTAPAANLILLQNGVLAVYDELTGYLPLPNEGGPNVFLGMTTYGAWLRHRFTCVLAGHGKTIIGSPTGATADDTGLRSLHKAGIQIGGWDDVKKQLIMKLVINTCLNPLTAILGVLNGQVLTAHGRTLIRQICNTLSLLIPHVHPTFSPTAEELYNETVHVAERTAKNRNSMLVDVEIGRETEVDFIVGFWIGVARKAGVDCGGLELLTALVRMREELKRNGGN